MIKTLADLRLLSLALLTTILVVVLIDAWETGRVLVPT
jgi:hypothetical protein